MIFIYITCIKFYISTSEFLVTLSTHIAWDGGGMGGRLSSSDWNGTSDAIESAAAYET
jgi:hypothetical protein